MPTASKLTSVVTGGAGFLGSHLTDLLLREGHHVVVADSFVTGSAANLEEAVATGRCRIVKHDVNTPFEIARDFPEPVDFVFHLAAPASPLDYMEHPIPALETAALGTRNALEFAAAKRASFLLVSTGECYGENPGGPLTEDSPGQVNPTGPRGIYDEARRFGEALTMAWHRHRHLNTHIARLFDCYGPRMRLRDGRLVAGFLTQALAGEPLTIFGDGTQRRSFLYVSDAVEALHRLALSGFHEPVNLGDSKALTVREYAAIVLEVTGNGCGFDFRPLPENDAKVCLPDIDRARRLLKWQPRVAFREGVTAMLETFRERAR